MGCGCQKMGVIGTWPSDVTAAKRRIDPSMISTDDGVRACTSLPLADRAAWDLFYGSWRAFFAEPEPFIFGSAVQYDEALGFEEQLTKIRSALRASGCSLSAAGDLPSPKTDPVSEIPSVIKWASAAVILGAIVWGVRTVVK